MVQPWWFNPGAEGVNLHVKVVLLSLLLLLPRRLAPPVCLSVGLSLLLLLLLLPRRRAPKVLTRALK